MKLDLSVLECRGSSASHFDGSQQGALIGDLSMKPSFALPPVSNVRSCLRDGTSVDAIFRTGRCFDLSFKFALCRCRFQWHQPGTMQSYHRKKVQ
jgi:hypothetical protein